MQWFVVLQVYLQAWKCFYLDQKNVIYSYVADIVQKYLKKDKENFEKIKKKLTKNKKIFQLVYLSIYPEVYNFVEKWGIDLKNKF